METPPPNASREVLSQSDVEQLLAQVADQESWGKPGVAGKGKDIGVVQPYDFRVPVFLSAIELRKIRVEHEEFIKALAARLSNYLRLEFGLQMSKINTLTFAEFSSTLANPTHIALFKVEPLNGICILEINPRLGLTIVDRLMGGAGASLDVDRDLSEIEVALLDQAVHIIIGEWCNHWVTHEDLRPSILAHENNGRYVQTSAPDCIMLSLLLEARIGNCMEKIQIAFPYTVLEPLTRDLNMKLAVAVKDSENAPEEPTKWRPELNALQVPITAHVPALTFSAKELACIKPGDVLTWGPEASDQINLHVAALPKFTGRLGRIGNNWAVEISKIIKS